MFRVFELIEDKILGTSRWLGILGFIALTIIVIWISVKALPGLFASSEQDHRLSVNRVIFENEEGKEVAEKYGVSVDEDAITRSRREGAEEKAKKDFREKYQAALDVAMNEGENLKEDLRDKSRKKRLLPNELKNLVEGSSAYKDKVNEIDENNASISDRCQLAQKNVANEAEKLTDEGREIARKYSVSADVFGQPTNRQGTGYEDEVKAALKMDRACPRTLNSDVESVARNYLEAFPKNYGFGGRDTGGLENIHDYILNQTYRPMLNRFANRDEKLIEKEGLDFDDLWDEVIDASDKVGSKYGSLISDFESDGEVTDEEYLMISLEISQTLPILVELLYQDLAVQRAEVQAEALEGASVRLASRAALAATLPYLTALLFLILFLVYLRIERNLRRP